MTEDSKPMFSVGDEVLCGEKLYEGRVICTDLSRESGKKVVVVLRRICLDGVVDSDEHIYYFDQQGASCVEGMPPIHRKPSEATYYAVLAKLAMYDTHVQARKARKAIMVMTTPVCGIVRVSLEDGVMKRVDIVETVSVEMK